jgi:hypothetical protein
MKRKTWKDRACVCGARPETRYQLDIAYCGALPCWDKAIRSANFVRLDEFQLEQTNGEAIMDLRCQLKERYGVEAAFIDDVVGLAIMAAVKEATSKAEG